MSYNYTMLSYVLQIYFEDSHIPNIVNLNDLFGSGESLENRNNKEKNTINIKVDKLYPFKNHPFKLYEGERLEDMVESIKEFRIITPILVRPLGEDKYEILSGHNRTNAGAIAGLDEIPAVVIEELTDEEAMLIVTETNLIQRSFSELSHSEKARILVERHNAIKEQGKRTELINEIESLSTNDLEDEEIEEVSKRFVSLIQRSLGFAPIIPDIQNDLD